MSNAKRTIFDLHAHPALKTWLYEYKLEDDHRSSPLFDPFQMQTDLPKLEKGGVGGAVVAHYLPECGITRYAKLLKWLKPTAQMVAPELVTRIEDDSIPNKPFYQTLEMLDRFEAKIAQAQRAGKKTAVAYSFSELQKHLAEGTTCFVHSIEGAHSLGRRHEKTQTYLDHLEHFFRRGVCLMTLAHFFENDLASPVDSIPHLLRELLNWKQDLDPNKRLTNIGVAVVEAMLDIGMIVDLSHCTEPERAQVYELNNRRAKKRPLVFTHVGAYSLCQKEMNPKPEEIIQIRDCGGVIGVIFVNDWLAKTTDLIEVFKDQGVKNIVNTIKHIGTAAQTFDCVAIGTDYDGMTDPPNDLPDASSLQKIVAALEKSGMKAEDIEKVFYQNVLRVLEQGWSNN